MSKELKDQFGNDIPRAADSASVRGQMISEETEAIAAEETEAIAAEETEAIAAEETEAIAAEEVLEEKPKAKTVAKKANK